MKRLLRKKSMKKKPVKKQKNGQSREKKRKKKFTPATTIILKNNATKKLRQCRSFFVIENSFGKVYHLCKYEKEKVVVKNCRRPDDSFFCFNSFRAGKSR